jgi:hypothetical protein
VSEEAAGIDSADVLKELERRGNGGNKPGEPARNVWLDLLREAHWPIAFSIGNPVPPPEQGTYTQAVADRIGSRIGRHIPVEKINNPDGSSQLVRLGEIYIHGSRPDIPNRPPNYIEGRLVNLETMSWTNSGRALLNRLFDINRRIDPRFPISPAS